MSLYSLEVHLWEFSVSWIERTFFQRKYTLIPGNLVMLPTWLPFHLNFCLGISILKDWAPETPGKLAYGQVFLEKTLWFIYQEPIMRTASLPAGTLPLELWSPPPPPPLPFSVSLRAQSVWSLALDSVLWFNFPHCPGPKLGLLFPEGTATKIKPL